MYVCIDGRETSVHLSADGKGPVESDVKDLGERE